MANRILSGLLGIAALGASVVGKQMPNSSTRNDAITLTPDELVEEERDYAWVKAVMPRDEFRAIRLKNKQEREQFGDGANAPHWPESQNQYNRNGTLHRGVWVDDASRRPTDAQLDAFRDEYWRTHEVVRFTLVEGEQTAPMGRDHAMIRVRASSGIPGEIRNSSGQLQSYVPCVSVRPVSESDFWATTYTGQLPMELSFVKTLTP